MLLVTLQQLIFFGFALLLLTAASLTILSTNPVHSALFLVLAFLAAAILWIGLAAEFLGLLLILVYVGAVMTFFLFVLMTLNLKVATSGHFVKYAHCVTLVFLITLPIGLFRLYSSFAPNHSSMTHISPPALLSNTIASSTSNNTQALGVVLYTRYAYPFEVTGVLLLVAIIAAISLNARPPHGRKRLSTRQQSLVKRQDRVKLVKMETTKRL